MMKKQNKVDDENNSIAVKTGSSKELPFNQDACFTKCIVQLLLINAAAETVEKFYDQLSLHVRDYKSCQLNNRTCTYY